MKRKFRRLLIMMGCMCLLAAAVYVAGSYFQSTQTVTIDGGCYQYAFGMKDVYEGSSRLNHEDDRTEIRNQDKVRTLSSSPVYYENDDRFLLPSTMSYIRPVTDVFDYRLDYFTEIFRLDGSVYIDSAEYKGPAGQSFLYDGEDTYVFLEPVTLTWRDETQYLDAFSYVKAVYGESLEIYVHETDTFRTESIGTGTEVQAEAEGYSVDLGLDILTRGKKQQLLFADPEQLDEYEG